MKNSTTYYQPFAYSDDGTCINWGEMPEELASFMVFPTKDECIKWLEDNGYNNDDYAIVEYHDDDIENPTFINRYGEYEDGTGSVSCYNTENDLDEGYVILLTAITAAQNKTGERLIKLDETSLYEDADTLGGRGSYHPVIVAIDSAAAYEGNGESYALEKISDYDDYIRLADAVDIAVSGF